MIVCKCVSIAHFEVLHGRVGDFQSNPLRIDFEVANNSFAGWRFLYRLASTPEVRASVPEELCEVV